MDGQIEFQQQHCTVLKQQRTVNDGKWTISLMTTLAGQPIFRVVWMRRRGCPRYV